MKESPGSRDSDKADDTRFNETLKRMLKTPPKPKPHRETSKKSSQHSEKQKPGANLAKVVDSNDAW
ncbi:hypothetical protein [Mesorhizobium sp.]|uniref:hypothetical protein n=1 Tax=Mesorhizobium sp. TaxID=1871066 RepID=UPI000FEA8585|nr:hypothetical protein [Mesorhizobium sp.]RWC28947.1 MAG: hypothetical protein EOS27_16725 [Mesorhizobium sp.]TIX22321.1 MAG: hypothetical protein E5V35_26250 [Mesorhizobium sp.]